MRPPKCWNGHCRYDSSAVGLIFAVFACNASIKSGAPIRAATVRERSYLALGLTLFALSSPTKKLSK